MLRVLVGEAGYGAKVVLRNVSLHVDHGEIVTIIGRNGVGKSTLLNAIFGICQTKDTQINFQGKEFSGLPPREKIKQGLVYEMQGARVFVHLSTRENLELAGFITQGRHQIRKNVEKVLQTFPHLAERIKQPAGTLSGGERQMLALGMILMSSPRLCMLDEPSGGLSPLYVDRMYEGLKQAQTEFETALLLVEQNLKKAAEVSDRIYCMEAGRIQGELDKGKGFDLNTMEKACLGV